MSDYLLFQMEGTDPLEFLKLSQGHDLLKLHVCKQQTLLSDLSTAISVSKELQIQSDRTVEYKSLEDMHNEKNRIFAKVQQNLEERATTNNRKRYFGEQSISDTSKLPRPSTLQVQKAMTATKAAGSNALKADLRASLSTT